jgi:CMP-N-acetylneuraminic acid synthetase
VFKVFIPIQRSAKAFADRNLLLLDGVPLWLRCLRRFSAFQVFVDTDCDEILGAINGDPTLSHVRAYSRGASLRGTTVSINQLLLAFLNRFRIYHEPVIQMHVTTPFLRPDTVRAAAEKVQVDSQFDSAVSCTLLQKRLWRQELYGFCPVNHNPLDLQPSDALPPLYIENSAFFIFQADVFRQTSNRVGFRPWFQRLEHPEFLEVKSEEDWQLVRWVAANNPSVF